MWDKIRGASAATWAALALAVSAIIRVSVLFQSGVQLTVALDVIVTVFLILLLFKQTKSWVYAVPFAVLAVLSLVSGGTTLGMVAGAVCCGLLALFAAASYSKPLSALRPISGKLWFLPAVIKLGCYLYIWYGWNQSGALSAAALRSGMSYQLFLALGYLLVGRWFAEEA